MIVSGSVLPVRIAIGIVRHDSSDASISQTLSPLPAGISTSRQAMSGLSDLMSDKAEKASYAHNVFSPSRSQRRASAGLIHDRRPRSKPLYRSLDVLDYDFVLPSNDALIVSRSGPIPSCAHQVPSGSTTIAGNGCEPLSVDCLPQDFRPADKLRQIWAISSKGQKPDPAFDRKHQIGRPNQRAEKAVRISFQLPLDRSLAANLRERDGEFVPAPPDHLPQITEDNLSQIGGGQVEPKECAAFRVIGLEVGKIELGQIAGKRNLPSNDFPASAEPAMLHGPLVRLSADAAFWLSCIAPTRTAVSRSLHLARSWIVSWRGRTYRLVDQLAEHSTDLLLVAEDVRQIGRHIQLHLASPHVRLPYEAVANVSDDIGHRIFSSADTERARVQLDRIEEIVDRLIEIVNPLGNHFDDLPLLAVARTAVGFRQQPQVFSDHHQRSANVVGKAIDYRATSFGRASCWVFSPLVDWNACRLLDERCCCIDLALFPLLASRQFERPSRKLRSRVHGSRPSRNQRRRFFASFPFCDAVAKGCGPASRRAVAHLAGIRRARS